MRLSLGSGRHYWPGFTNIDMDPRADIVGDVAKLDFPDNSVDEIYGIHLFEHFHRREVYNILKEWRRVLKDGGKLVLEMPCLDKIAQMVVDGEERVAMTIFGLFGDFREPSPLMRHQWCYTIKEGLKVLEDSGFSASYSEPVFHVKQRDMRLTGIKRT